MSRRPRVGRDADGAEVADLTAHSTITSSASGDTVDGGVVTVSGAAGPRTVTAAYGTLSDAVALSATPGALAELVVTPSATTVETGDAITVAVEGRDADGNTLGDVTASATLSSSAPGDVVGTGSVEFAFDPAARDGRRRPRDHRDPRRGVGVGDGVRAAPRRRHPPLDQRDDRDGRRHRRGLRGGIRRGR